MNRSLKILLIVFISFIVYFIGDELYFKVIRSWFYQSIDQLGVIHILAYILTGIPLIAGTYFVDKSTNVLHSLGFAGSFPRALLLSFVCTLPMLIGFGLYFSLNLDLSLNTIIISGISAALFEEIYFRGFLFGLIFKNTKLGFFPSVISGAILFASIHFYQSNDLITLIGIFLITFIGAILFSWVYCEWKYNVWVPISIHFFMNFYWMLFSVSDHALGDLVANICRVASIILIICVTVLYKKRKRELFVVTKSTFWVKCQDCHFY